MQLLCLGLGRGETSERSGRLDPLGAVIREVPLGDGLVVVRLVAELEALRVLVTVALRVAAVRGPRGRAPGGDAAERTKGRVRTRLLRAVRCLVEENVREVQLVDLNERETASLRDEEEDVGREEEDRAGPDEGNLRLQVAVAIVRDVRDDDGCSSSYVSLCLLLASARKWLTDQKVVELRAIRAVSFLF